MFTSNIKVGKGIGINGGNPTAWWSTTPHISVRTTSTNSMGVFPMRPSIASQYQKKLIPFDFKKLGDKLDGTKDPYNHIANILMISTSNLKVLG